MTEAGSCTGNAQAGRAEYLLLKQGLSRLFADHNETVRERGTARDVGLPIGDFCNVAGAGGLPNEKLWSPREAGRVHNSP
jgi:hypothetical protein